MSKMDDDNSSIASSTGGDSVGSTLTQKRKPQKKHYPFGTPSHKFHPYSEYQHLRREDFVLFHALSTATGEINPEIRTGEEEPKKSPPKKKPSPIELDEDILKDIPNVPEGVEPCKRVDCKAVVKSILESQSKNREERDDLMLDIEHLMTELQNTERENSAMEEKLHFNTRLTTQFEATLQHLNMQIERLENRKVELQHEKEELGNKMMVTETEKQNWVRQTQLAEKALADAMWRGKHAAPQTPPEIMPILRKSSSEVSDLHSVANTSYNSLAAGRVIDFNERPKGSTISSIPDYLKMQLLPQVSTIDQWDLSSSNQSVISQFKLSTSKSGVWSKASETRMLTSSVGSHTSALTNPTLGAHLMPIVLTSEEKSRSKIKKLHTDNNPFLELPADAYRGYTPTGSPTFRRGTSSGTFRYPNGTSTLPSRVDDTSTIRSMRSIGSLSKSSKVSKSMSSLGADMSMTFSGGDLTRSRLDASQSRPPRAWDQLDPIFYDNRRPATFNRDYPVGKQRVRPPAQAPPLPEPGGQYTKLLTHRHPGLSQGIGMDSVRVSR